MALKAAEVEYPMIALRRLVINHCVTSAPVSALRQSQCLAKCNLSPSARLTFGPNWAFGWTDPYAREALPVERLVQRGALAGGDRCLIR